MTVLDRPPAPVREETPTPTQPPWRARVAAVCVSLVAAMLVLCAETAFEALSRTVAPQV